MKLPLKPFTIKDFSEPGIADRINTYLDEIREAVMSRLDFQQSFTIHAAKVAGNEFRILHNLGYIPNNFLIISKNGAGEFYPSGSAWTTTAAYFKCTTASIIARVVIW